jgi:hypothetical protein
MDAIKWIDDGHTVTAKYSDRRCTAEMVIKCPGGDYLSCTTNSCHVRESAQDFGWDCFAGNGDFDLVGDPKPILWRYPAPEEIELRVKQ